MQFMVPFTGDRELFPRFAFMVTDCMRVARKVVTGCNGGDNAAAFCGRKGFRVTGQSRKALDMASALHDFG